MRSHPSPAEKFHAFAIGVGDRFMNADGLGSNGNRMNGTLRYGCGFGCGCGCDTRRQTVFMCNM